MKILVTGVAGFIGSNFIHYMVEKYPDYQFVGLDALTYAGNMDNIKSILEKDNFEFVKMDIRNRVEIFQLFEKQRFETVINFAAETHVDRAIENPSVFLETNILGTQILLDAARAYGNIRFHQISTDEVYGDLPLDRPDLLFTEQSSIHTSSPYSASKAGADLLCLSYFRTFQLPVTISRCSNNYGPYQFPEKLIPLMINNAVNDNPLPVYGKGLNVRDWIYVDDHSKAIDVIVHQGEMGEVYNVGGHQEFRNIDVVKLILKKINKTEDLITYVTDRKGHDLRYAIDTSKMEKEFDWRPSINFEDGMQITINWYLNNNAWMEKVVSGEYQNYYHKMYSKRGDKNGNN